MDYRTQLLSLSTAYCQSTGRSESRIATLTAGSGAFFDGLRLGKGCTVDTYLKVKRWFGDNWPADLAWPEFVDRPGVLPESSPDHGASIAEPVAPAQGETADDLSPPESDVAPAPVVSTMALLPTTLWADRTMRPEGGAARETVDLTKRAAP